MTNVYHSLATSQFSQNWTNINLITADDNWNDVPSIIGYRGDNLVISRGVDPQTVFGNENTLDVNANKTDPNIYGTGGVTEFEITNPVVALQGSTTAGAPFLLIHLNTTGVNNVNVSYNLRDIDGSTDNAVQQVALQYRVGTSGNFINIPAGYVADASSGPNLATLVTPIKVILPSQANNQSQVQLRIITTDAPSFDEWIGVDDILITSTSMPTVSIAAVDGDASEAGANPGTFRISRTGDTSAALNVNYNVTGQAINGNDYTPNLTGTATIPTNASFVDITVTPVDDSAVEQSEAVTLTLVDTADYDLSGSSTATVTIIDNDTIPTVSIAAVDGNASEAGANPGTFRISRTGDTSAALNVNYSVTGQAINGNDYRPRLTSPATISAGQSFVDIAVTPVNDREVEQSEAVTLTLVDTADYDLSGSSTATVTIIDNDNVINGTLGRDTLTGTTADDIITGSRGGDILTGNAGSDRFVYTNIRDAGDTITDFVAQQDQIDLTQLFNNFSLGGLNYITATNESYLSFGTQGNNTTVFFEGDGSTGLARGIQSNNTTVFIDPDGSTGSARATAFLTVQSVSPDTLNNPDNFLIQTQFVTEIV